MRGKRSLLIALTFGVASSAFAFEPSGLLEIHVMNVQHTNAMLVVGPDGTRILMDAGKNSMLDYLESIGLVSGDTLHYTLSSHLDSDHIRAFDNLFPDYDVTGTNWYNGSDKTGSDISTYFDWAENETTAGALQAIPVGQEIALGDGAILKVVAVHCELLDLSIAPDCTDDDDHENDLSVAVLIRYDDFDFLWAGDLGGDFDDEACTGREYPNNDGDIETPLASVLTTFGEPPLLGGTGVDVLHVSHHGSDSSTNSNWMNALRPQVAVISVGSSFGDPEPGVVDGVLRAGGDCITADPALVLQTDEGDVDGSASTTGYVVGSVIIESDGLFYGIGATGTTADGVPVVPDERGAAAIPTFLLTDENAPDCPMEVTLSDLAIHSEWTWQALHTLRTENSVQILSGGVVTLRAGSRVALGDGFQVDAGGELTVEVDLVTDCSDRWEPESLDVSPAG